MLRLFFQFNRFFVIFFVVLGYPQIKSQEVELINICNIEFEFPKNSKVINQASDMILFEQKLNSKNSKNNKIVVQWLIICNRNIRKTSYISELENYYKDKGEPIRNFQEFKIANQVEAASFNRFRIKNGRKLYTHGIYFATRNHEYNINLIPQNNQSLKKATLVILNPNLQKSQKAFLKSIQFISKPDITISEAQYRWRLRFVIAGFIFFITSVAFLVLRKKTRKRLAKL